ncbi:hypothetical protein LguiA_014892 [Lonicera macranthoides]
MATAQLIESHSSNAEILHGDLICKERSRKLLEDLSLPKGLLPLEEVEEVGYNKTTGFVWLKQKKKTQHKFKGATNTVMYDTVITAFAEDRRLKKVTGVKSKELLIMVAISDISIKDPSSGKITFSTPAGFSRSYPASMFDLEDEQVAAQKSEN